VCAQGVWDFEWRCRHCLRQYSAWQMCSCRKHRQPWWTTTSECHKPGCTNGELCFCQIMHRNECDIFPDDGIWLCCGSRSRDGKGCMCPKLPTKWQPEFADVRLYDDFICSCRTTDTPLCCSVCPGHPPVPLADEDLPSEEKKCEGPTGCRHCRYCPCGDNCCEGRANEHEMQKLAATERKITLHAPRPICTRLSSALDDVLNEERIERQRKGMDTAADMIANSAAFARTVSAAISKVSRRKCVRMNCKPPCERPLESDDHIPGCIWR
jgi:hypothetical protein